MAKQKYYAVRVGQTPGIFRTWDECKASVNGYPKAQYKSFSTEDEAKRYLNGEDVSNTKAKTKTAPKALANLPENYAFTDGSFCEETNRYGYGGYLIANGTRHLIEGSGQEPGATKQRQIVGEIHGVMAAIRLAETLNLKDLTVFYDYNGIQGWAEDWNANNAYTKAYKDFMQSPKRTVNVTFVHVPAHTGIEGNEDADVIAKVNAGHLLPKSKQVQYDAIKAEFQENQ